MSTSKRKQLLSNLEDKEYRDAFVDANIGNTISGQLFSMRKRRDWSQQQLAEACGMAQTRISVMEDPDYQNFSIKTLKRLASAFDVALIVRFAPFSELVSWLDRLSPDALAVPSFVDERDAIDAQRGRTVVELRPVPSAGDDVCLGNGAEIASGNTTATVQSVDAAAMR